MKRTSKLGATLQPFVISFFVLLILIGMNMLGIRLTKYSYLRTTWQCVLFLIVFLGVAIAIGLISTKICRKPQIVVWIFVGWYCLSILFFYSFRNVYSTDLEHYLEGDGYFYEIAPNVMPKLNELSDFCDIHYVNFYGKSAFFEPRCYLYLRVTYPPEVFAQKVEEVTAQLPELTDEDYNDPYGTNLPFQIGNETYRNIQLNQRVDSLDDYYSNYYYSAVIGINEEEHYIVYFFFSIGASDSLRISVRTEAELNCLDTYDLLP